MTPWVRRHAPLVTLTVVALVATAVMVWTGSTFITSLTANVWGLVVLLIVFDLTPRDTQEKREQSGPDS